MAGNRKNQKSVWIVFIGIDTLKEDRIRQVQRDLEELAQFRSLELVILNDQFLT